MAPAASDTEVCELHQVVWVMQFNGHYMAHRIDDSRKENKNNSKQHFSCDLCDFFFGIISHKV